ncbi:hypothetical protein AAY473_023279 [Plecturocebus cupreus]
MLAKSAALKFVVLFSLGVSGLTSFLILPFSISGKDRSAFPELQTSPQRRLSPVYSTPSATEQRRRQKSHARGAPLLGMSWSGGSKNLSKLESCHIAQACLKFLASSNSPTSVSNIAVITDVSYHAQL